MSKPLSIIVVEKDRDRAWMIVDGLREAGDSDVFVIGEETRDHVAARLRAANTSLRGTSGPQPGDAAAELAAGGRIGYCCGPCRA